MSRSCSNYSVVEELCLFAFCALHMCAMGVAGIRASVVSIGNFGVVFLTIVVSAIEKAQAWWACTGPARLVGSTALNEGYIVCLHTALCPDQHDTADNTSSQEQPRTAVNRDGSRTARMEAQECLMTLYMSVARYMCHITGGRGLLQLLCSDLHHNLQELVDAIPRVVACRKASMQVHTHCAGAKILITTLNTCCKQCPGDMEGPAAIHA